MPRHSHDDDFSRVFEDEDTGASALEEQTGKQIAVGLIQLSFDNPEAEPEEIHELIMEIADERELGLKWINKRLRQCREPARATFVEENDESFAEDRDELLGIFGGEDE